MKTFDEEYMLTQLKNLLAIDSTSGQFREIQTMSPQRCSGWVISRRHCARVVSGVTSAGEGNSLCLLSHLDDIGLMVRHIFPNGTLKVVPVGGLRACAAEHENVRVYSRGGVIRVPYSGFSPASMSRLPMSITQRRIMTRISASYWTKTFIRRRIPCTGHPYRRPDRAGPAFYNGRRIYQIPLY